MIDLLREIVAGLFLLAGCCFILIGAVGLNRMPDLFTRIHAASLIDTTGVGLVLIGLMFLGGFTLVTVKLAFLLLFLLFMGPVATHALAAAALNAGIKPSVARTRANSPKVATGDAPAARKASAATKATASSKAPPPKKPPANKSGGASKAHTGRKKGHKS